MCVSVCLRDTMGAVLSWFAACLFALVLDTANALKYWRPHKALEDSHYLSEGLGLEDGDLGADSLEWCKRGIGGGDAYDEYFDFSSWHSNNLSDVSGEDSPDALLGLEDAYVAWGTTANNFHTGQRIARQRELGTSKDGHRDAPETYVRQSRCSRRKSPENHVDSNIPLKFMTRDLCSVKLRTENLSTEKLQLEQSSLQAICTETQLYCRTDPYSLHVQSQHNTDPFDTKLNSPPDTEVKLHAQHEESDPNRLNESTNPETCVIHIDTTEDNIVETKQQLSTHEVRLQTVNTDRKYIENTGGERLEICKVYNVKAVNNKLLNIGLNKCHSECNERHNSEHQAIINEDREIQDIKVHSKDKGGLYKRTYCNGTQKIESNCKDNTCIADAHGSDVINAQTFDSTCTAAHSCTYPDFQLITEVVVASQCITEAHGTKTNSVSHDTKSELRDTLNTQISGLAHKVAICCSQTLCDESANLGLSKIHPQVCTCVTNSQHKALVSDVNFQVERFGCVGTTTEGTKSPGTVNEIGSSITSSPQTTASFLLDACAIEQTVVPKVSTLTSLVPLADSDRETESLTERQPDEKQPQSTWLLPWQVPGQTQDLIPKHLDQGGATHRHIQSDTVTDSKECLHHHPFKNNQFISAKQGAEDTSPLLSENFQRERRRVGSPCSLLQQNKEQGVEERPVYLDQEQTVDAVNVNLQKTQLGTTGISEHSELRVTSKATTSDSATCVTQHVPSEIGKTSTCLNESIQDNRGEHLGVPQKAVSQTNIESAVSKISSHCKIPEPSSSLQASLSLLSDSNNNTKASIKGARTGKVVGCLSGTAPNKCKNNERIICLLVDPLEDVEKPQAVSDLIPNCSSEDSLLRKDLASCCHLSLTHADELETLKTYSVEDNVTESLEFSNSERNEGLMPFVASSESIGLLVDSEFQEGKYYCSQAGDHSLPDRRRGGSSESFKEYALAEEYRDQTQISLPTPLQEVRTVRYSHPDVSLTLLAISSLEPILEAERSLENCSTTEDDFKEETKKEYENKQPAEVVKDNVNLSGYISSLNTPHQEPEQEQKPLTHVELEPEVNPVLCGSSEKHCRPMTVTHDAASYTSASSNCDELEDPCFVISARNANPDKMNKRSKTKATLQEIKALSFPSLLKCLLSGRLRAQKVPKVRRYPRSHQMEEVRRRPFWMRKGHRGTTQMMRFLLKVMFLTKQSTKQLPHCIVR